MYRRSIRYLFLTLCLIVNRWDSIRPDLVAKMPILDEESLRRKRGGVDGDIDYGASSMSFGMPSGTSSAVPQAGASLLDLDDIFGGGGSSVSAGTSGGSSLVPNYGTPAPSANSLAASGTSVDLLSDIFSASSVSQPSDPTPQVGNLLSSPMQAMVASNPNPSVMAFDKNGLSITMDCSKPDPSNPSLTKVQHFFPLIYTFIDIDVCS